jgi:hypothetical protein
MSPSRRQSVPTNIAGGKSASYFSGGNFSPRLMMKILFAVG